MTLCTDSVRPLEGASDWRVIYICSAARCGSTFTDMFIGGHSKATSLGEANFLGKAIALEQLCSCGQNILQCGHWNKVYSDLSVRSECDIRDQPYGYRLWDAIAGHVVDAKKQTRLFKMAVKLRKAWLEVRYRSGGRVPLLPSQKKAICNKIMLYEAVANQWGKKLIVDSSKNFREAAELSRLMPGRVKVILLTRDGRGVFLSYRRSGLSRNDSLSRWKSYYRRAFPLLKECVEASHLLTLKYEDLATNPEEVGKRVCGFVGMDFEGNMLDLNRATRHMVNGNDTRFSANLGIKLDEKWRTDLEKDELDFFTRFGGEQNRLLGYE